MNPTTIHRIDTLAALATKCVKDGDREGLKIAIERALRYQDRDTRHACAEAVNALANAETNESVRIIVNAICHRAHNACMNVRAI